MTNLSRLEELRDKLLPQFEEYRQRHNGEIPCVQTLVEFMIDEKRASMGLGYLYNVL